MDSAKEPLIARFFVLPILSGVLLAPTLPWIGLSFFAWVALIPLFLFVSKFGLSYTRAFQGGFITGIVYLGTVVYPLFSLKAWWWLQASGVVYENKIILLFWILYAAVLAGSIFFGFFAVVFKKLHREGFFSIFILAALWVFLEYVRAKFLFGFTWGHLGYSLHESLPLLQFARWGGVYPLSALIVLVNVLFYYGIHQSLQNIKGIEGSSKFALFLRSFFKRGYPYAAAIIMIAGFFVGNFLLKAENPQFKGRMAVVIVQPGNDSNETLAEHEERIFEEIERSLSHNPSLMVVPESSLPSIVIDEASMEPIVSPMTMSIDSSGKTAYAKLVEISKVNSAVSFVVGVQTRRETLHYNSIIVLEEGEVTGIYRKRKLFPFSEKSVPWFPFKTPRELSAGENDDTLMVRGTRASALICSESLFPELVNSEASFIIAVGNDGVFENPVVAQYNHVIAKFTAVEAGKYMVRAMKTGVSSIIDPHGQEISRTVSSGAKIISGRISLQNTDR